MCQRKPGPRCAAHTYPTLVKAREAYEEAERKGSKNKGALRSAYGKALHDYDATPTGQRKLEAELAETTDAVKTRKLNKRLSRARENYSHARKALAEVEAREEAVRQMEQDREDKRLAVKRAWEQGGPYRPVTIVVSTEVDNDGYGSYEGDPEGDSTTHITDVTAVSGADSSIHGTQVQIPEGATEAWVVINRYSESDTFNNDAGLAQVMTAVSNQEEAESLASDLRKMKSLPVVGPDGEYLRPYDGSYYRGNSENDIEVYKVYIPPASQS